VKRKHGRPKGSKNKVKKVEEKPLSNAPPKSYKFLGYCPKCFCIITSNDLETKFIYKCVRCANRDRVKSLKDSLNIPKAMNYKDFIENTVNSESLDMPKLADIDPGDLNVAE